MQEILDEIASIEAVIKDLHKQSHNIIYRRKDISQPLSFSDMKEYDKINSRCLELQKEVASLKTKLAEIKKAEEALKQMVKSELTEQERHFIFTMEAKSCKINVFTSRVLVDITKLNRARVNEHLRTFLVAGFIEPIHVSNGRHGYYLTSRGRSFISFYKQKQKQTGV